MSACVARTAFPPPPVARALRGGAVLGLGHVGPLSEQLPLPLAGGTPGRAGLVRDLPCAPGPPDERRDGALPLPEGEGPGLGRPALARRQLFNPVGKPLVALGVPQLAPRVGVAAAVLQAVVDGGPPLLRRVRLGGPAPLVERAPGLEPFPVPGCEPDAGWMAQLPYRRRRLEAVLDAGLDRPGPPLEGVHAIPPSLIVWYGFPVPPPFLRPRLLYLATGTGGMRPWRPFRSLLASPTRREGEGGPFESRRGSPPRCPSRGT